MEDKINELLNKTLSGSNLAFTYENAKLLKTQYYDDKNYFMEIMFYKFNGTDTNHHNVINCYDGNLSQIMYQDSGFPGASLTFDRTLIPDETVTGGLIKVARIDTKYHEALDALQKEVMGEIANAEKKA